MRIESRCADAIGRVGEWIAVEQEGSPEGEPGPSFRGSIQPRFGGGEELSGPPGYGAVREFRLFAECSDAAMAVKSGDVLRCGGLRYQVRRIETPVLAGQGAYRRGELLLIS